MFNYLKKGISTPIVIGIVLIFAILVGGVTVRQFLEMQKEQLEREQDSISNEITVLSPTKGEIWTVDETYQIQWSPSDNVGIVGISLSNKSLDQSASIQKVWQRELIPNIGTYSFTVPELLAGDRYQFYISSKERYGYSGLFTIIRTTDNWKTYKNEEYGYEIQYPKDWSHDPNLLRGEPSMVFCPPEFSDQDPEIGCEWQSHGGHMPSSSAPILLFGDKWEDLPGITKEEKKGYQWCKLEEIRDINNISIEVRNCDGRRIAFCESIDNKYLYRLDLVGDSKFLDIFNQMISTFRFLD